MERPRKRWKRLLARIVGGLAVVLLMVVAMPLWLPWVLKPVASMFDVNYDRYDRQGWSRFELKNVHWNSEATTVRADVLRAPLPLSWWWQARDSAKPESSRLEPLLEIDGWSVRVRRREDPKPPPRMTSTFEALDLVARLRPVLLKWLPKARLNQGELVVHDKVFVLPQAEFEVGKLRADVQTFFMAESIVLEADLAVTSAYRLNVALDSRDLELASNLRRTEAAWEADGDLLFQSNRIQLEAQFGPEGWWPERAMASADDFELDLGGWTAVASGTVRGSVEIELEDENYNLSVGVQSGSEVEPSVLSELTASIEGEGTFSEVTIQNLEVESPYLTAALDRAITFSSIGEMRTPAANFLVTADLADIPELPLQGRLEGSVDVRPVTGGIPSLDIDLKGDDLATHSFELGELGGRIRLNWPVLAVDELTIEQASDYSLVLDADVDLAERTVWDGTLSFAGMVPEELVPGPIGFGRCSISAGFQGPIDLLSHQGSLSVEALTLPRMRPLGLTTEWSGNSAALEHIDLRASAGGSDLKVAGSVTLEQTKPLELNAVVDSLALRNEEEEFSLVKPVSIGVEQPLRGESAEPHPMHLEISPLIIESATDRLSIAGSLDWPIGGDLSVEAVEIALDEYQDWVEPALPDLTIRHIDVGTGWSNGPLDLSVDALVDYRMPEGELLTIETMAASRNESLVVSNLTAQINEAEIISVTGSLPIAVMMGGASESLQIDSAKPFQLAFESDPHPSLLNLFSTNAPLTWSAVNLEGELGGHWNNPKGRIVITAENLESQQPEISKYLPPIDSVALQVILEHHTLNLDPSSIELIDDVLELEGSIPDVHLPEALGDGAVKIPKWRDASLHLHTDGFDMGRLIEFYGLDEAFSGRVLLDLSVAPGLQFSGKLQIEGGGTGPLLPSGAIRDINGSVVFDGKRAVIESLQGFLGGRPVEISGVANLEEWDALEYDVSVRAQDLPLARSEAFLIRGDLDLHFIDSKEVHPRVEGNVNLHHSLFLQEIRRLLRSNPSHPRQRPPYFSIETPPFSSWDLDIEITGERFMSVLTPAFRGEVSAALTIGGTFKEPLALGDVTIDRGRVQFPFGNLAIRNGRISLTQRNPYDPQLSLMAVGRNYGYDIQMQVTGTGESPNLTFTAVPPLTSEQVLLLLTAGELPRDGFSFSNSDRVSRLGIFVGKSLLSKFGASAGMGERLTISTGEDVTTHGQLTYSVEFKLNDRWSAVGEYDRFNALNGGIKWRVYSK